MTEHRTRIEREDSFLSTRTTWWAACSCGWMVRAESSNDAARRCLDHTEAGEKEGTDAR
jgi:hypothetical protein